MLAIACAWFPPAFGPTALRAAAAARDLASAPPESVGISSERLRRLDGVMKGFVDAGTWFWIDSVEDFVFVGMIQHQGRTVGDVQGVSRNLVYQSILK